MPVSGASNREALSNSPGDLQFPAWMLRSRASPTATPGEFLRQLRLMGLARTHVARAAELGVEEPCPMSVDVLGHSSDASTSECEEDDDGMLHSWVVERAEQQRGQQPASSLSSSLQQPWPTSLLSPGQIFQGSQRLASAQGRHPDDWQVEVRIQMYDPAKGYICGIMEAFNVPLLRCPVVTFWEGEIVDNGFIVFPRSPVNHTFSTQRWGAGRTADLQHWSKFEGYSSLHRLFAGKNAGQAVGLAACPYIFMRWKEQFFVSEADCGLTIGGFYYVQLNRQDGHISGFYYDQHSAPFQELSLNPKQLPSSGGYAFGSYELR